MTVRMKKSKYLVLALIITCLMVACVAPAAYAIAGVDDAVIGAVVASCAMFGVDWAIKQGAQALSRADIGVTIRSKLLTAGVTDADMQMISNGIKHPAQGIFTLSGKLFKKLAGFASDMTDEIDASGSDSISVGASTTTIKIGAFDVPLPIDAPGTYGGQYIEDACNLGVWNLGTAETKVVNGVGFRSVVQSGKTLIQLVGFNNTTATLCVYDASYAGSAVTLYCDIRPTAYLTTVALYVSTRANWSTNYQFRTIHNGERGDDLAVTLNQLLSGNLGAVGEAGVSLNVRKSVGDKPLPELALIDDDAEISVSTGLDFTDNNGLVEAMMNVVNGTGSYVPVYDYSTDINDLTTATNGVLSNTTGILSGVQSIAGTLTEVLTAVKSILLSAFDFLASLPGYLAAFAGKFAGIWHYVVSWVGSLGSFASFVFGVWGNLPYAMLVPVYASAVIVLVVFVFKRFFG